MGLDVLQDIGRDLNRPECVLCTSDGSLFVSDWEGGVTRINGDGSQSSLLASNTEFVLRSNGIALREDGSFLIANLGDEGGIWTLRGDGQLRPFLLDVDGQRLPPSNFVLDDGLGRVWITVSTRVTPRAQAYRPDIADGFVVLVDKRGARIVTDKLGYTNEVQLHPSGEWLYVNETFGRRTSRMRINGDGTLGQRETVAEYGAGVFPDGLCFDEEGGFWIVSLVSNRVIRVGPDGEQELMIDDSDRTHMEWVENAFLSGVMDRPHLDTIKSQRLASTSSIAFGGPERRHCYLGCLLDDHITCFESPVAGAQPAHWYWQAAF